MSKIVPNFSNILHILKIGPKLLLTPLGDIASVSKAKIYGGTNLFAISNVDCTRVFF